MMVEIEMIGAMTGCGAMIAGLGVYVRETKWINSIIGKCNKMRSKCQETQNEIESQLEYLESQLEHLEEKVLEGRGRNGS